MSTLVRNNNKVTVGLGPTKRLHALSVLVQMTKGLNHAHSTLRFFIHAVFAFSVIFFCFLFYYLLALSGTLQNCMSVYTRYIRYVV